MPISNNQKAVIHIAKARLGLDEESYRDALEAHAGVRSAKDLDYNGFKAVMKHFESCGFRSSKLKAQSSKRQPVSRPGMATVAQIRKIYALWQTLEGSWYERRNYWKALRGFLRKRFRVDHENFLTPEKAHQVIEAIKSIGHRAQSAERTEHSANGWASQ